MMHGLASTYARAHSHQCALDESNDRALTVGKNNTALVPVAAVDTTISSARTGTCSDAAHTQTHTDTQTHRHTHAHTHTHNAASLLVGWGKGERLTTRHPALCNMRRQRDAAHVLSTRARVHVYARSMRSVGMRQQLSNAQATVTKAYKTIAHSQEVTVHAMCQ